MNDSIAILSQKRFSQFLLIAVMVSSLDGNIAQAQSTPPSAAGNTSPPNFDRISPREFDNVRPLQQDLNYGSSGSQQFFRQGNDNLYFLPEDKSDSILQIDRDIETKDVEREEVQQAPLEN